MIRRAEPDLLRKRQPKPLPRPKTPALRAKLLPAVLMALGVAVLGSIYASLYASRLTTALTVDELFPALEAHLTGKDLLDAFLGMFFERSSHNLQAALERIGTSDEPMAPASVSGVTCHLPTM